MATTKGEGGGSIKKPTPVPKPRASATSVSKPKVTMGPKRTSGGVTKQSVTMSSPPRTIAKKAPGGMGTRKGP